MLRATGSENSRQSNLERKSGRRSRLGGAAARPSDIERLVADIVDQDRVWLALPPEHKTMPGPRAWLKIPAAEAKEATELYVQATSHAEVHKRRRPCNKMNSDNSKQELG